MEQQKHRRPARKFTIRKGGYITKSQLGKRGTILSESQLFDCEVKRKLGRTVEGVTVITIEDLNTVRLFRYKDIEEAEKELMLENIHDVSMRRTFCEIWGIEIEKHPDTHFSHEELLRRGHWTPERVERFLSFESFAVTFLGGRLTYPIYLKSDVRKVERSDAYKMLWQTEKQQKAAARKAVREKEKITQTRLISERGWTKGLINELLGEPDVFVDNPHYKSAAPMRLYFLDRVKHIEQTSDTFKSRRKDRRKSPVKTGNPPNDPNIQKNN
ncbi:hypothetical protein F4X10_01780 [Candidatus Poribacteria bacterium]|nr:hypothetical protein [Candidatus Poribacteria bacterium]